MKRQVWFVVLMFLLICTLLTSTSLADEPEEDKLLTQLQGGDCRYLSELSDNSYLLEDAKSPPDCSTVGFFTPYITRNFKEACIASGAICLLALPKPSARALTALENFLLTGPNDVDTGDGTFAIRTTAAIVYSRLAGAAALPALRQALERNDPTTPSPSGSFPENYSFQPGTSHATIRKAIKALEGE